MVFYFYWVGWVEDDGVLYVFVDVGVVGEDGDVEFFEGVLGFDV